MEAVAIYGAILGTLGFILSVILAVIEFRRDRPKLKVRAEKGFLVDDNGETSEPVIILSATNLGNIPILIQGVGWLFDNGERLYILEPYLLKLPVNLGEQRSCKAYYACRWFRNEPKHQKIRGVFFQDDIGRIWIGKIKRKDRKNWEDTADDGWKIEWDVKSRIYYRENETGERFPLG